MIGAVVALALVWPSTAASQSLDECEALAASAFGQAPSASHRAFLQHRESASFEHRFSHDGCVGLLAFGGAQARDVDLLAHTALGEVIQEDVESRSWGWARACGHAGDDIVAIAHLFAGRGEVRVLAFEDAAEQPPDLGREVGACFARSPGVRHPIDDVGPLAPMRSLDAAIDAADRESAALGWAAIGAPSRGTLEPGGAHAMRFPVRAGACYRVEALAGPEMRDVSLSVARPDGEPVAEDRSVARDAHVAFCADGDGTYSAIARAASGIGTVALRARELSASPIDGAFDDRSRIESAELASRLAARAMTARLVAIGHVQGTQTFSVHLPAGCSAVAAIGTGDLGEGELDLALRAGDALLAWDLGPSPSRGVIPIAWTCAERERDVQAVVGSAAGGRFLLVEAR